MNESDFMWAVGLFEGEGSVGWHSNGRGGQQAEMTLMMVDEDVVARFHSIVGVGHLSIHFQSKTSHSTRPLNKWKCSRRDDIRNLLTAMLPHLGKRRQARAAYVLTQLGPG